MKRVVWLSIVLCLVSLISFTPNEVRQLADGVGLFSPRPIFASSTVRFLYDGDGARVAKIEEGKTTLYVGDLEKNLTTGEVTKYYGLGGKRVAFSQKTNGQGPTTNYLVSDHLGSLRSLLAPSESASGGEVGGNLSGSSIAKVSYYPYGSVRTKSDNLPSRQYTGQINDEQTGLYFYNARYYNPQTANFLQADKGGGANKYAYVSGNPINFNDPSGNDEEGIDFASLGNLYPGTGISSSQEINSTILGPITCLNTPEGCTQEQIDQWNTESLSMTGQVSYAAMNVIFIAAAAPSIAVLVEGFIANLPVIGNKAAPEMEQIIENVVLQSIPVPAKQVKLPPVITVYKAIPAKIAALNIKPRVSRGNNIYSAMRPSQKLKSLFESGETFEDIAWDHAKYSGAWSPALSWTTNKETARRIASNRTGEEWVVIETQIESRLGVYIPNLASKRGRWPSAESAIEYEFTTFGVFPNNGYTVVNP